MFDDTGNLIAAFFGWGMLVALPIAAVINMVLQGLNRPWRKHLHKLKVDARWREICAQRDLANLSDGK